MSEADANRRSQGGDPPSSPLSPADRPDWVIDIDLDLGREHSPQAHSVIPQPQPPRSGAQPPVAPGPATPDRSRSTPASVTPDLQPSPSPHPRAREKSKAGAKAAEVSPADRSGEPALSGPNADRSAVEVSVGDSSVGASGADPALDAVIASSNATTIEVTATALPFTATPPPVSASATSASIQLQQENQTLRDQNQELQDWITELERSFQDCQASLQHQLECAQYQEQLVQDRNQELLDYHHRLEALTHNLETAQQAAQRHKILAETLSTQLEASQDRITQMERECGLTQKRFAEQTQRLVEMENECRDLKTRLSRQQRYTLQFKAALEKCLEVSVPNPGLVDPTASSVPSLGVANSLENLSQSPDLFPRSQPVQPWSSPDGEGTLSEGNEWNKINHWIQEDGAGTIDETPADVLTDMLPEAALSDVAEGIEVPEIALPDSPPPQQLLSDAALEAGLRAAAVPGAGASGLDSPDLVLEHSPEPEVDRALEQKLNAVFESIELRAAEIGNLSSETVSEPVTASRPLAAIDPTVTTGGWDSARLDPIDLDPVDPNAVDSGALESAVSDSGALGLTALDPALSTSNSLEPVDLADLADSSSFDPPGSGAPSLDSIPPQSIPQKTESLDSPPPPLTVANNPYQLWQGLAKVQGSAPDRSGPALDPTTTDLSGVDAIEPPDLPAESATIDASATAVPNSPETGPEAIPNPDRLLNKLVMFPFPAGLDSSTAPAPAEDDLAEATGTAASASIPLSASISANSGAADLDSAEAASVPVDDPTDLPSFPPPSPPWTLNQRARKPVPAGGVEQPMGLDAPEVAASVHLAATPAGATGFALSLPSTNWPSPVVHPLRPSKKRDSLAAVELPSFPKSP